MPKVTRCCICGRYINGTVVAKFTLNKVEEIRLNLAARFFTKTFNEQEILQHSFLSQKELENYLLKKGDCYNCLCGYAWHIDNLFIFSEPKALSEFAILTKSYKYHRVYDYLTCPPQSWCFVEI